MNARRTRCRRWVFTLVIGALLLGTMPLLSVPPATATTCPTAPSGRYLGTWNSISGVGGVGMINATITPTALNGTIELATGTTVLLPGAVISGAISCGHIVATSGPVTFIGDIAASGTEMSGTYSYFGDSGTWRTGLVTDETTSTGTDASTPGGTSSADPIGVAVSSPTAGTLTIQEASSSGGSLFGYPLFDTVVRIVAPPASVATPLQLTFTLAASATGGAPASSIVMFRDGIPIADCTGAPQAIPDPCVTSRVDLSGGGAKLVVLTSHASTWNMGALPVSDSSPPTINAVVTGTAGNAGWYVSDVTVSWVVEDTQSTISSTSGCDTSHVLSDTAGISFTCTATSSGGTSSSSVTIKRDATAPELAPSVAPNPVTLHGAAVATAGATDAMSGLASTSCDVVDTATVGPHSVSCDATDVAGNTASANGAYDVQYGFTGFAPPVDMGGVLNDAKAGKVIPLKWRLVDANGEPVTTLTAAVLHAASLSCSWGTTADRVEEPTAGGSGLQNLGDGYYQVNWKSPSSYARSCKTATLDLGDGSTHNALFAFTR